MSMHAEFTKDFATRTLENLYYIETAEENGENTYEVTQVDKFFFGTDCISAGARRGESL